MTLRDLKYLARDEAQTVLALLAQIPSHALRRVHLVCTSSSFDGADDASLQTLDDALALPAFAALELALTFASTACQADLEDTVKRGLHQLDKRGLLHATFPEYAVDVEK